jgi:hypothetical protein
MADNPPRRARQPLPQRLGRRVAIGFAWRQVDDDNLAIVGPQIIHGGIVEESLRDYHPALRQFTHSQLIAIVAP